MNGIIVIDKPEGWTSHDVVGKLRGLLRERRIGHGGTLDPLATGVLPVFVGRATRAAEFCASAEKEYIAGFRPGLVTDTQDTTGTVISEIKIGLTREVLEAVLPLFRGAQKQIPPMYSAVKIDGKKLYSIARKGGEVERAPRDIEIKKLDIIGQEGGDYLLDVVCSKGTYIRTLCHDIGARLGCGGAMSSLRRVRAGLFSLSDAVSLCEVQKASEEGRADLLLKPVDTLFLECPALHIGPEEEKKCRCGAPFDAIAEDGRYRVYGADGRFLMLGDVSQKTVKTVKSFFEV
ncbi:MAG: tRNA pseudouridine(55) synthase TruB [Oscillospiraceae bacterium]